MNNEMTFEDFAASVLKSKPAVDADTVRQNVMSVADTNPDQFAEATKLGRTANVPPSIVAADLPTYQKQAKLPDDDLNKIVNNYPAFREWLDNPDNAKLVHDDISNTVRALDMGRSVPAGFGQGIGQGVQGIGTYSKDTSRLLGDIGQKDKAIGVMSTFQNVRMMTALAGMALEPTGRTVKEFSADTIAPPKERQNTSTNIASGVGQVASQIVTFYATGGLGNTLLTFGQGAQQQADRLDEAGITDPSVRVSAQTLGGIATAATERVELGVILKGIPSLDKVIGKMSPALQNKWLNKPIDIAAAGGAEAAQETVEGFLQDLINYGYDQDVEFLDGLKQQAGEAGAVGAISRALVLGITSGKGAGRGEKANEETQVLKDQLAAGKENIQASKLQARDPQKMAEALKAANPENQQVTIDSTVLQQFFQSGIDPEEFFKLSPSAREQFEQSDIAGTDISIPYDEFLHAIASAPVPNSYDFMLDFVKSDQNVDMPTDGWDMTDPEQVNAFIKQAVDQTRQEFEGRFTQQQENELDVMIERKIRDNLMNRELMGEKAMSPEVAASNAAIYGANAKAWIERGGQAARRVLETRFGDALSIEGFRPPLPRQIGTGSVYYDRLRSKVKARKAADKKSEENRSKVKDFFGNKKEKRTRATPTPLINAIIKMGGIQRGSVIAKELDAIGLDAKKYPRLYTAKGGLKGLDGIPLDDLEADIGVTGIFSRDKEFNGYVSENELVQKLRDESFGNYIRTDEQLAAEQQDEYDAQILDILDRQGIDIETASADEINAALKKARDEYALGFESGDGQQYFQSADKTNTPEFKKWAGEGFEIIESDYINDESFSEDKPYILKVFHGTTHDFEEFKAENRGQKEGQFGAVNYFTSSFDDADNNYTSNGADLTNRITARAERLAQEMEDNPEDFGLDENADFEAEARAVAERELKGNNPQVLELYVKTEKPFIVGGNDEKWIQLIDNQEIEDLAIDRVSEYHGITVDEVKENIDDYQDEIDEARWEIEADTETELYSAIERVANETGIDAQELYGSLSEVISDGEISHTQLEEALRSAEPLAYAEDPETGAMNGYHLLGRIIQELGFDSIILKDANLRFSSMDMNEGVAHIHVFDANNTNIKSVENTGAFNPNDPRIYFQSAFHGSPFHFDQFTLDKIGAGEGQQAYGWGLYFAGKKEVAEYYRENLANDIVAPAKRSLAKSNNDVDVAISKSREEIARLRGLDLTVETGSAQRDSKIEIQQGIIKELESFKESGQWTGGQLYEVSIPEDDVLLNWDKLLSEQPPKVRARLNDALFKKGTSVSEIAEIIFVDGDKSKLTGKMIYQKLSDILDVDEDNNDTRGDELASKALNEAGIKGIKYLDGSSRGKGEGSHNYVIFDDSAIQTLKTYYQDNQGVTQFMSDGKTIIKLFEKADMSTFMHETGHLFLDVFADIAAQPDAPQAIKDDFAKALEWMGVDKYENIKTVHHEKFARGFEAYLYQGEAPSIALKNVFDRFKLWLTNIYKSIKALNVNVTPEMKDVFDRMLATDTEIEALKSNQLFDIDQATMEMLNPKQQADYLKRKAEAMQNAKDKLFRKAIRQKRRENTEWWKEEFAAMQTQVEGDLKSQPVYRAIQFLQTGQDFDGKSLMVDDEGNDIKSAPEDYKLNEKAIVDEFNKNSPNMKLGKEELKYLPKGIRTKTGGLDPRIVADMFGFKSAIHMMEAMKVAEPYKYAVQKMTEDRMIAKHGDMLNDGTIEKEALAMVMAEDTKAAQVELKALSEKTGALYPSDGDFAKAAAIALGSLKVDTAIKPDRYYRAALRASREYGKALQAKQYEDRTVNGKDGKTSVVEGAATWKRREILNKHLYKQSIKAKEEMDSALEKFKQLDKKPPKGNARLVKIDPEYHQKIWDVLAKYNLNPKISQAKELKLQLAALNQWIQAKEVDEEAHLMMPPELLEADGKTHYRDLTVNEFRAMRDLVLNLETQGRNKRKFQTQNAQRDLEELIDEMVATAEQFNTPESVDVMNRSATTLAIKKMKQGDIKGAAKKFILDNKVVNGLDAVNTKTAQVMALLDGGDNFGIWTQTVYEPMQAAEIQKNVRLRAEYKNFKAIMDKHFKDMPFGWMQDEIGADGVTNETMLSMALHQGTEDNRAKLIDGYQKARGWDAEFIDRTLAKMTKRDWEFVQDVWDYLDTFWPETSAVEKRRFGYAPEKIEAVPFEVTTADGHTMQLRGGYMRIMYDGNQDAMAANDELAQSFKELTIGRNARAATKRGSQIERVSGVKRPINLSLDVLTQHISEQVGIITMSETVENVNKVLRSAKVQETVQAIVGRSGKEMLDLWIKDVAVGNQLSAGKLGWLKSLRSNYTVGRLGLKPVTALLQLSGLSHTVADIGFKQTFHGLMKTFSRGNPWAIGEDIAQKSKFMQERKFTLNRDVADALSEYTDKAGTVKNKVSALMLYPMQKMQEIVDNTTWLAAYDKANNENQSEEAAIRIADMAVARLQSSGLTSDLAAIERGTVGTQVQRNEFVKASTMFFSYFNAKYNLLKNKNIQFKNKQISATDLATSYLMALLIEGIISSAIMGQIDWDKDDDDELSAGEIAIGLGMQTINTATSTMPFVRTVAGGWQGFGGETAAMGQLAGLGEFAGRLVGTGEKLINDESDDINGYQLTRNTIDALNAFYPIPAATLNQVIRGMEKEDKTGDANALDYLVYQKK